MLLCCEEQTKRCRECQYGFENFKCHLRNCIGTAAELHSRHKLGFCSEQLPGVNALMFILITGEQLTDK